MQLNIRTPKKQLFSSGKVFYVPSKSGGEEHIVVQVDGRLFCDCKDFMTRKLPLLGTSGFSHCTHGKQVATLSMGTDSTTVQHISKRYGVFTPAGYRSHDLPNDYPSLALAKSAIRAHERLNGKVGRVARAL
jgi:hypothetical protein